MTTHSSFHFEEANSLVNLQHYFELRRRAYFKEYPWLPPDFGLADETDRISHIILVDRDGPIVGGARLTLSSRENPRHLPLEEAGFDLRTAERLAHLNLAAATYGEISRLAVDPGMSEGLEISFGLTRMCCEIAAHHGADILFGICPARPALLNARHAKRMGIRFETYGSLSTVFGCDMTLCTFMGLQAALTPTIHALSSQGA
jgi:hypothetical protein